MYPKYNLLLTKECSGGVALNEVFFAAGEPKQSRIPAWRDLSSTAGNIRSTSTTSPSTLQFSLFLHSIGLWLRCRQDVIPASVEAGLSAGLFPLRFPRLLTRIQRAVAPIAATLLAGGMSLYPKRTAFAEEPKDLVWLLEIEGIKGMVSLTQV